MPHSASLLPPALLAPACDTCLARDTCSLPSLTPHVTHLICVDSRLTHRAACPLRPSLAAPHPACTLPLLSPSLALYFTSNDSRAPPLVSSPTPNAVGMPCRSHPRQWPLGARAGAPQVVLAEPWAPASAAGCWWCSRVSARRRLPPRRQESVSPGLPSLMLQMYVSSVSEVSEACCICFI
jgi:hypothetical protein